MGFLGPIGSQPTSALVAENGTITAAAQIGDPVADIGKIVDINGSLVNSKNRNVLVVTVFKSPQQGPATLTMRKGEELVPVLKPGMAMPGGGTFKNLQQFPVFFAVSEANTLGQHAFLATITEGDRLRIGAYLMDGDGNLSLILKEGSITELGEVRHLGPWVEGSEGNSLNSKGQVALPITIDGFPSMVALLTPNLPAPSP